ncbi:glycosyltransferase family 4 protein [Clostridium sp. E02]|uniref:glycosyltransferase family 4 protein n=1 Tax=Clostridium sp. E02 TaxID=2487134 RepID=UPI000F526930|nr:glycosyltransferase family 4 protein [Clostridium sp. E02]
MKIIVVSTIVPFVNGGGVFIVDWLEEKLREYGHQVQSIKIPFVHDYRTVMTQMLGLRMYHLEDECDRLIAIRTPSYLLKHPDKYLWFIHHYREMYDLWGSEYENIPKENNTFAIREFVKRADDLAFREAKKIYTNSEIVSRRLLDYNNISAQPVYPPLLHPEQFYCNQYGNFIYYSSRICGHKRQLMAIEAMKFVKTDVKLVISGKFETTLIEELIKNTIKRNELENRVKLVDRWITEHEKAEYYANCLAAIYIPFDEDSYGYPSLEAHHSCKAVISCTDSGGTSELIKDGYNGYIIDSEPHKLAEVFDQLYENKKLAETMGNNGFNRINELDITWDNVIRRFTE